LLKKRDILIYEMLPRLQFLHSENLLNAVKLAQFRRLSTSTLKSSLLPGQPGSLKVRPDGTALHGHHRLSILIERDEDIHSKIMKADLFWIPGPWRGRLAVATRPRGGDWLDDEASAWRQADLDVIVSLLENEEANQLDLLDERRVAEDHALRFISFPILDRGVPASLQEAVSLMGQLPPNWRPVRTLLYIAAKVLADPA
jgi:hypothetical protein